MEYCFQVGGTDTETPQLCRTILFNKPVSDIETINDLDHDVVNLFRCIQEDAEHLARMVMVTPFSREKYEDKEIIENEIIGEIIHVKEKRIIQKEKSVNGVMG